jgi:hypothetical protein
MGGRTKGGCPAVSRKGKLSVGPTTRKKKRKELLIMLIEEKQDVLVEFLVYNIMKIIRNIICQMITYIKIFIKNIRSIILKISIFKLYALYRLTKINVKKRIGIIFERVKEKFKKKKKKFLVFIKEVLVLMGLYPLTKLEQAMENNIDYEILCRFPLEFHEFVKIIPKFIVDFVFFKERRVIRNRIEGEVVEHALYLIQEYIKQEKQETEEEKEKSKVRIDAWMERWEREIKEKADRQKHESVDERHKREEKEREYREMQARLYKQHGLNEDGTIREKRRNGRGKKKKVIARIDARMERHKREEKEREERERKQKVEKSWNDIKDALNEIAKVPKKRREIAIQIDQLTNLRERNRDLILNAEGLKEIESQIYKKELEIQNLIEELLIEYPEMADEGIVKYWIKFSKSKGL